MRTAMDAVTQFHVAMDISHECEMPKTDDGNIESLRISAERLHKWSEGLIREFKTNQDPRFLRAHLIFEEASEFGLAMYEGDELKALDGLTDLLYVVVGTAVQFGWDLDGAFNEVHRSNMTKTPQKDDPDRARVRDKGETFVPPNLEPFIQ